MKPLPKFNQYLLQKGYCKEIAGYYSYNAHYYTEWLKNNKLSLKKAQYTHLMEYVGYLQKQKSTVIVNKHLRSIELYYDYLQLPNIAINVRVRGSKKHLRLFLNEEELDTLYKRYETRITTYFKNSNKLLLGLTIYQGLELKELRLLELANLDLEKGTLYVGSGKHFRNSRTITLKAHQILPLHSYIIQHRNKGVNGYQSKYTKGLFLPQVEYRTSIAKQLKYINKELLELSKVLGIPYQSLKQLRQSCIVLWIKNYGLRQAQYLSGHKGIDSIERYQQQDIEDLSKQIELFHPLQ
jgi:integrase/recombinase XerD